MKQIRPAYQRKEVYSVNEVLRHVVKSKDDVNSEVDFDGDLIKMFSSRYRLFAKSCTCVRCGVVGTYFAKERSVDRHGTPTSHRYHFNLYGINSHGHEVMITKDHIVPRSKGGADNISNYQTMCYKCNQKKGNKCE